MTDIETPSVEKPVQFIQDVVDDAGTDGAVVGLSGGIDSTTTAFLAVEALGAENVKGVVMPSEVNEDENMSDAERVATDLLDIPHEVIEIEPIMAAYEDAAPDAASDEMAHANTYARIRSDLLYMYANAENRVVLGTGNRSEASVGYFTKYGDGAVDCHPIGHLYKTEVRELARDLGVPEDIVTKTPTAGLWEGQTDEDELGLPYPALDAVLREFLDAGTESPATIAEKVEGVSPEEVEKVIAAYNASAHKRETPPAPSR